MVQFGANGSVLLQELRSVLPSSRANALTGINQIHASQKSQGCTFARTAGRVLRRTRAVHRPWHQVSSFLEIDTQLFEHIGAVGLFHIHSVRIFRNGNKACRYIAPQLDHLQIAEGTQEISFSQHVFHFQVVEFTELLYAFDDIVAFLDSGVEITPRVFTIGGREVTAGRSHGVDIPFRLT